MSRLKSAIRAVLLTLLISTTFVAAQWSMAAVPTQIPAAAAQPLAERNRAVALRVFDELFNQRRPEVAAEIYAPNFRNHGLHKDATLEVDQGWARGELHAFPDLHMTVLMTVAEGDLVTILWVFKGTHARSGYGSFPPTGAVMEFRGITIFRIVDGRIVDEWTTFNQMSAYSQAFQHLRWWILAAVCLFLLGWMYVGHVVFRWIVRTRLHS